jgi:hypothetical protein
MKNKYNVKVKLQTQTWNLPISSKDQVNLSSSYLRITDDDGDELVVPLSQLVCYFIETNKDGTPRG